MRQGENLSPILFAIFLNDFGRFISQYYNGLDNLSHSFRDHLSNDEVDIYLKLFTLLYADDTIVLAENHTDLQSALNGVKDYCNTWNITVNTSKTQVVIFSRGKIRRIPEFYFGTEKVDVVDNYTYLGVTFNYNNKFTRTKCKQISSAKKAMFSLLNKSYNLQLPLDLLLELFDQLVSPILLYGCEVWGFEDIKQIEAFHLNFCKRVLKLKKSTPNCMVYGELGRHKLIKLVESRMVTFWGRIANGDGNKLSCMMYKYLRVLHDKRIYTSPWLLKIKSIFEKNWNTLHLEHTFL